MKKQPSKPSKLSLSPETIKLLETEVLTQVNGGGRTRTSDNGDSRFRAC
jgi:hypothetical protein